jgi:hypothetical protein
VVAEMVRESKCQSRLGLAGRASTSYRTARAGERGRVALRGIGQGGGRGRGANRPSSTMGDEVVKKRRKRATR